MILKDQLGNEIPIFSSSELLIRTDDEFITVVVDNDPIIGKNVYIVFNDQKIRHGQLQELLMDDHPQYLDIIRHKLIHDGWVEEDLTDNLTFKFPVIDIVSTKPASPSEGDRYAMSHLATSTERGTIVEFKDGEWKVTAKRGFNCFFNTEDEAFYYWSPTDLKWNKIEGSTPGPTPTGDYVALDGTTPLTGDWAVNELDPLTDPAATGYTLKHLPYPSAMADAATKAYTLGRAFDRTWVDPATEATSGTVMSSMALGSRIINASTDTWVTTSGMNIAPGTIIQYVGDDETGLRRFVAIARTKGLVYYNLTKNDFYEWNGSAWVRLLDALGYNALEALTSISENSLVAGSSTSKKLKDAGVGSFINGDLSINYAASGKYGLKVFSNTDTTPGQFYAGIVNLDSALLPPYTCAIHPRTGFVVNMIDSVTASEIGGGFLVYGTCGAVSGGGDKSRISLAIKPKGGTSVVEVLQFYADNVGRFISSIEVGGNVNIPTGSTYNINGIPHTHAYAPSVSTSAITGSTTLVGNSVYVLNYTGSVIGDRCELTLPVTCNVGDKIRIFSEGTHGWKLKQNASQYVKFNGITSVVGVSGYLQTPEDEPNSWIELTCIVANTMFRVTGSEGHIEVNA